MEQDSGRSRFFTVFRLAAPVCVVAWRLLSRSPSEAWRDWILVLALLDLTSTAAGPGKVRTLAFAVATAFLLGLYCWGQGPHTLRLLGMGP
jgi:hypothetical protein